jgi:ParB-like chromosome segregation protein Spo0J
MDGTNEETVQDVLDGEKIGEIRRDIDANGYAAPGEPPDPAYRLEDVRLRDLRVHDATTMGSGTEAIQIRGYDAATVLRYAYAFRELPPIEVLLVDGNALVVDGFHRRRAAERLGLETLRAWVKDGTYDEALDRAVMANLRHGRPFQGNDLHAVILRLRRLHPKMSGRKIATMVGTSHTTVDDVMAVEELRREAGVPGGNMLPHSVGREIVKAAKDVRSKLANRACDAGWTVEQARQEVAAASDPPAPEDERPEIDEADGPAAELVLKTSVPPVGQGSGNRWSAVLPHERLEQALTRLREVHEGRAVETFVPDDEVRSRLVVVACRGELAFLAAVIEAAEVRLGDEFVADEGFFHPTPRDGSARADTHDTPSSPRTLRRRTKAAGHVA